MSDNGEDDPETSIPVARFQDVDDDVYSKSVEFVTSKDTHIVSPQFEGLCMISPQMQCVSVLDSRDAAKLSVQDGNGDETAQEQYLWLPSTIGRTASHICRIERIKQLKIERSYGIFRLYTPKVASTIFIGGGLLLLSFWACFFVSSMDNTSIEVPYSDKDQGPITITLHKDLKAPIYIYYKVYNFYVNHKNVAYESSPKIVSHARCKAFSTFEDILRLRCIDDKNTLNGKHDWCKLIGKIPEFKMQAYPCGLISATMITDNFEICSDDIENVDSEPWKDPGNIPKSCLHLSMRESVNGWNFVQHNEKKSELNKGFLWMDLSNSMYRSWVETPYDSTFLKPYAVLYTDVKAGTYKIYVKNNFWPASSWGARKAIFITTTGRLGTSPFIFEIILIVAACLYIFTGIMVLTLHKMGIRSKRSPWEELKILCDSDEVGQTEAIIGSSPDIKDKEPLEVPIIGAPCLCQCR